MLWPIRLFLWRPKTQRSFELCVKFIIGFFLSFPVILFAYYLSGIKIFWGEMDASKYIIAVSYTILAVMLILWLGAKRYYPDFYFIGAKYIHLLPALYAILAVGVALISNRDGGLVAFRILGECLACLIITPMFRAGGRLCLSGSPAPTAA